MSAATLQDLPVLASTHGVLDVLVVARPEVVSSFKGFRPTGWVYDICARRSETMTACPPGHGNLYGGTRLQLEPGDVLKMRLVNKLPPVVDAEHAQDPGGAYLGLNPTNIHTHGLLVSPRFPSAGDPTYGDNVFVLTLNPANGLPASDSHLHGDVRLGYTDYKIVVPRNHPSGMYWFHPHAHGIALNQVSAGLAGMITVGDVRDYVCRGSACASFAQRLPVRHILLKDAQVLADGRLQDEEDPAFCAWQPAAGEAPRRGSCPGVDNRSTDPDGADYRGGKWFLSLNGQPYPTIPVASPGGEIWRITSASGSNSYDLRLRNRAAPGYDMVVQVLSIDGVAVQGPSRGSMEDWLTLHKRRGRLMACPDDWLAHRAGEPAPVCASSVFMMPSSRVELWVAYRDAAGHIVSPPAAGGRAVLQTVGVDTGPEGDQWPAADLAQVDFAGGSAVAMHDAPVALKVGVGTTAGLDEPALAADLSRENSAFRPEADCRPLPKGHHRRIFYGNPDEDNFGLGYEEVDASGTPVPGSFVEVRPFDPDTPTVCLTLAPGNKPASEVWELVNLTGEDHNFHIHQVRFKILEDPLTGSPTAADTLNGGHIAYDNLPLRHGRKACLTVGAWHDAQDPSSPGFNACDGEPVKVLIPFSIAGDFVFHCHILEHEDGGMMARIRVRAAR